MSTLATESIVKITIEWGTGTVIYADKSDTGEKGALLSFDVVTLQGKAGGAGSIGSVNIILDDTDGTLKTLHDTTIIEGVLCTVEQVFTGGVSKTRTLLIGKICADIIWSEGERTLSFGIESLYKDAQIGYAPKSGDYSWMHPDAWGVVWPLCFGSVLRVPAVRVLHPYNLTLGEDIEYSTPSFQIVNGDSLPQSPTNIRIEISEVLFDGTMTGDIFTPTDRNVAKYGSVAIAARPSSDPDFNNPNVFWLVNNENLLRHYCLYCFDGSNYTVNQVTGQVGKKCYCPVPWDNDVMLDFGDSFTAVARYPKTSWPATMTVESNLSGDTLLTIAKDGWHIYKDAKVTYNPVTGITDRYICNLVSSYAVYEVFAHRTFFGKKIFCAVPSSDYTVNLSETLGTKNVTSITMTKSLSDRFCEGWDDDLYVSLISNVPVVDGGDPDHGANTADIIQWILETYTAITVDPTSFASVKTYLDYFPSNFAIFDQPNAVEICQEIAWQARCALTIINGIAYLTYLPAGGAVTPVESVNNDRTEFKSIQLGFSKTEDIITKITANWLREYSGEKIGVDGKNPARIYEKELNSSTYGLNELVKDFFIYNIEANVIASVDFWVNRFANVWRTISCRAFIDINDVIPFDIVLFSQLGLNFPVGGARGELLSIGHNTGEPIIDLYAQLAIKAGTMVHSMDYWVTGSGLVEDIRNGLDQIDYELASDNSCPTYITIQQDASPKLHFVFTEAPKQIPRDRDFFMKAEIQDFDGNLDTSIDPAFAVLEMESADRHDVMTPVTVPMTFVGGKWDNGVPLVAITITGGDKRSIAHLWIRSLDRRIFSSKRRIGSE